MKQLLASVMMMISLSACALTVDEVDVAYNSQSVPIVIGGADAVQVQVTVNDARQSHRDRISAKKNGYGVEMAPIIARQNISTVVTRAIEGEVRSRGFQLGNGPVSVLIEINKFYSDFKMGFWSGEAAGEVILNAQVKNADGKIFYSKNYVGERTVGGVMLASGDNAKVAVEGALSSAIGKMIDDNLFLQALMDAQRAMPKPIS